MEKKRVIICDDNEGIVEVAKLILSEAGHSVTPVLKGTDIFKIVEKENPHLIFVDLWMPDINGEEITRKLKENNSTKHIPVIIISGNADTQDVALKIGADGYINKPFDMSELEEVVKKYTTI